MRIMDKYRAILIYEKFRYLTIPNFIYSLLKSRNFSIQHLILAQIMGSCNMFCCFWYAPTGRINIQKRLVFRQNMPQTRFGSALFLTEGKLRKENRGAGPSVSGKVMDGLPDPALRVLPDSQNQPGLWCWLSSRFSSSSDFSPTQPTSR